MQMPIVRLQTPHCDGEYALGWVVFERDWGAGAVLHYAGSYAWGCSNVWIARRKNFAMLIYTNKARSETTDRAAGALIAVGYDTAKWNGLPPIGQRPTPFAAPFLGSNAAHVALAQVKVPWFFLCSQSVPGLSGFTQSPQTCSGFVGPTLTWTKYLQFRQTLCILISIKASSRGC